MAGRRSHRRNHERRAVDVDTAGSESGRSVQRLERWSWWVGEVVLRPRLAVFASPSQLAASPALTQRKQEALVTLRTGFWANQPHLTTLPRRPDTTTPFTFSHLYFLLPTALLHLDSVLDLTCRCACPASQIRSFPYKPFPGKTRAECPAPPSGLRFTPSPTPTPTPPPHLHCRIEQAKWRASTPLNTSTRLSSSLRAGTPWPAASGTSATSSLR